MEKKLYLLAISISLLLCLFILPLGILCLYFIWLFYIADTQDTSSSFSLSYPYILSGKKRSTESFTPHNYDDYQIIDFLAARRADKISEIENTGLTEEEEADFDKITETLRNVSDEQNK